MTCKATKDIEYLKGPIMKILKSSHYPKSVKYIENRLLIEGILAWEERGLYRVVIGKWLMEQKNIIAHHKNSSDVHVYMLKGNARKYWPEFLEDEYKTTEACPVQYNLQRPVQCNRSKKIIPTGEEE